MEEISEKEYLEAKGIVDRYILQKFNKKLSIYDGCTENDILKNEFRNHNRDLAFAFWITRSKEIPDRNPDCIIIADSFMELYTLEGSRKFYDNYDFAYKAMIKGFKRKKLIK